MCIKLKFKHVFTTMILISFSIILHMMTLSTYGQNRIVFIWFVRMLLFVAMILGTISPLIYASIWPGVLPPNIYTSKAGLEWKPHWFQAIGFLVPTCLALTITFYHCAKLERIRIVQNKPDPRIIDGFRQSLNSIHSTTGVKLGKHGQVQECVDVVDEFSF